MVKKFKSKLRAIGNSQGILIPSFVVDTEHLELNKEYEFKLIKKDGVSNDPET